MYGRVDTPRENFESEATAIATNATAATIAMITIAPIKTAVNQAGPLRKTAVPYPAKNIVAPTSKNQKTNRITSTT